MKELATDNTHTTIATWALAIERALQGEGVDPAPIFDAVDVDRAEFRNPDSRIPVTTMWKLWKHAVAETGDSAFGLTVANYVFPTHLSALLFALQSSETIKECVNRIVRYAKIVSTIATVSASEESGDLVVRFVTLNQPNLCPPEPLDAFMALAVKTFRDILGQADEAVIEVQFCHPTPPSPKRFTDFFKCPVHFGANKNIIRIKGEILDKSLPAANSELAEIHDQLLNDYLKRMAHEDIGIRVKKQILTLLPSGEVSQDKIASQLNMSTRNLHRKLAEQGTTFKTLLDVVREDLALRYLKIPSISINELTYMLGFLDQSSFTRAFRRWTGNTPTQFRKAMKDS